MSWILLTAGAQFINALVAIVDKYLVTDNKALPRPLIYAFYTCLVTAAWLLVYVLGLFPGMSALGVPQISSITLPTWQVALVSLLSAYTFFIAIVALYEALRHADTSDVMPVVGAVSAISTFGLAALLLGAEYPSHFILGIALLATGTLLVSRMGFRGRIVFLTLGSGIFFGLHYIAMKHLFETTNFDDGFFWSRIALILSALSLLLIPKYSGLLSGRTKVMSRQTGFLVITNKLLAGIAAFMILKATDLGDVAVVQALDGLKFVFILIITVILGGILPKSVREHDRRPGTIMRKFLYVTIICIGFGILFI